MRNADRRMFGFRINRNRRSSGGILHSGLLRGSGLGRLYIGACTFLFLDHLLVSDSMGIDYEERGLTR
jgi:hypothetical protein